MPYFKSKSGEKGYVNDEEMMARLETVGYTRLEGMELLRRIVWKALKRWGVPALCAMAVFHAWSGDFAMGLVTFAVVQSILD